MHQPNPSTTLWDVLTLTVHGVGGAEAESGYDGLGIWGASLAAGAAVSSHRTRLRRSRRGW
jgi:hypothetical protein